VVAVLWKAHYLCLLLPNILLQSVVVAVVELTVVILFFLLLLLLVADQAAQEQQVVRLELAVVREAEGNIKVLVVLAQQIRVGLVVLGQQMH
jgi:hypothetical protein